MWSQLIAHALLSVTNVALAAPHAPILNCRHLISPTYTSEFGVTFYKSTIDFGVMYNFRTPSCCIGSPSLCYVANGENAGQFWEACYQPRDDGNVTGPLSTAKFSAIDQQATDCMTNLHMQQGFTCISVAGSACQAKYISGGERIQNSFVQGNNGSGALYQLSGADSLAIQGAVGALVGINASTNTWGSQGNKYQNAPSFVHLPSSAATDDSNQNMPLGSLSLGYVGEDAC